MGLGKVTELTRWRSGIAKGKTFTVDTFMAEHSGWESVPVTENSQQLLSNGACCTHISLCYQIVTFLDPK